jgi:hypothetical protein
MHSTSRINPPYRNFHENEIHTASQEEIWPWQKMYDNPNTFHINVEMYYYHRFVLAVTNTFVPCHLRPFR